MPSWTNGSFDVLMFLACITLRQLSRRRGKTGYQLTYFCCHHWQVLWGGEGFTGKHSQLQIHYSLHYSDAPHHLTLMLSRQGRARIGWTADLRQILWSLTIPSVNSQSPSSKKTKNPVSFGILKVASTAKKRFWYLTTFLRDVVRIPKFLETFTWMIILCGGYCFICYYGRLEREKEGERGGENHLGWRAV